VERRFTWSIPTWLTANFDHDKPSLIDLDPLQRATGRKQATAVQRERLSERAPNGDAIV
jgi:hypothetical protein